MHCSINPSLRWVRLVAFSFLMLDLLYWHHWRSVCRHFFLIAVAVVGCAVLVLAVPEELTVDRPHGLRSTECSTLHAAHGFLACRWPVQQFPKTKRAPACIVRLGSALESWWLNSRFIARVPGPLRKSRNWKFGINEKSTTANMRSLHHTARPSRRFAHSSGRGVAFHGEIAWEERWCASHVQDDQILHKMG
jgi:hypothetical protein